MESYNEIKHRQLQTMLEPIRKQLKQYSPKTLCKNTMASFDENEQNFCLPSMGTDIFIHYPDFAIKQELDMWHHLTLLQYLDTADGTPLSGQWISLQQMPGGVTRGRGFDKDIETMFDRYFSNITAAEFLARCLQLGGKELRGRADVEVVIPIIPIPMPIAYNLSYWSIFLPLPFSTLQALLHRQPNPLFQKHNKTCEKECPIPDIRKYIETVL